MASYTDDFNRANGELGANWAVDEGDIHIVTNQAESITAESFNRARYASALDTSDQTVSATIGGKAYSNHGNVTARQMSSTFTCYAACYVDEDSSAGYRLRKIVAGVETDLATAASGSGTKLITLVVVGATQTMLVDGVEVCSATDTTITTGLYAGIAVYDNNGGRWENWSAEDYAAGASPSGSASHSPSPSPSGSPSSSPSPSGSPSASLSGTPSSTPSASPSPGTYLAQEGYRWRNDDGTQSTATWRQVQDTADTVTRLTNIRLRLVLNATGDPINQTFTLQYKQVGDVAWTDVDVV